MAYNPYTPYIPFSPAQMPGYSPYAPQMMPPMPQQQIQAAQVAQSPQQMQDNKPQIQNGGFVSVRSIDEAKNYPIEPGKSITFKDETAPYVYTKTMGFSQLDRPVFEKYRLVKEDELTPNENGDEKHEEIKLSDYALKSDFEKLEERLNKVEEELKEVGGV